MTENPCVTGSIPVRGTNNVSVQTNRTDDTKINQEIKSG